MAHVNALLVLLHAGGVVDQLFGMRVMPGTCWGNAWESRCPAGVHIHCTYCVLQHCLPACCWQGRNDGYGGVLAGDRPIEVTLQRAWQALTWRQKLQLGRAALTAAFSRIEVDEALVEQLKTDDAVIAFEALLSTKYPSVSLPNVSQAAARRVIETSIGNFLMTSWCHAAIHCSPDMVHDKAEQYLLSMEA